ncbi:PD-(D/E)XK nuclease family protein [Patescibacteria group bacterium]|nr:PD-(D/E)XK nuclease family protein [Patescibacteria group bacterium]MBU2633459.1 PD-(D/E)XK nuclease family protein [Patescibacteria group bacterium]
MAEYNPNRSPAWNYGGNNWKLSRSKIDLFVECPRCFYIDNKLGTKRPPIPSFQINKAVDYQLKQEFDTHRAKGVQHPLQEEYGIDAKPAVHEKIDEWRENFKGVQRFHEPTGFLISGAIDDLWINSDGEYIVVDYKATAKNEPVKELSGKWHEGYKRQMEVYQWLLRGNGLKVSNTGYFVYCTGKYDQKAFDKVIEFDVNLISYTGNDSWVEPTIYEIKKCLDDEKIPEANPDCDFCNFFKSRKEHELK